ncbi:MAG TPA: VOC family protein [Dehalococcoidales bacterium]|nr:VOC family protein [Dehalococcoidales bacterium]
MTDSSSLESILGTLKFFHYGIVVRDMEKSISFYEKQGIGPFKPFHLHMKDRQIYGIPVNDIKNKSMLARIGNSGLGIELIQPISGDSHQSRFLNAHGEGIHHIAFLADDRDRPKTELQKFGFELIQRTEYAEGGGSIYMKAGDVVIEIAQWPSLPY